MLLSSLPTLLPWLLSDRSVQLPMLLSSLPTLLPLMLSSVVELSDRSVQLPMALSSLPTLLPSMLSSSHELSELSELSFRESCRFACTPRRLALSDTAMIFPLFVECPKWCAGKSLGPALSGDIGDDP